LVIFPLLTNTPPPREYPFLAALELICFSPKKKEGILEMKKFYLAPIAAALIISSSQAHAELGEWSFSPNVGAVVLSDRSIMSSGSVSATVSGTVTWSTGETLSGVGAGEISVSAKDFDDMYDTPMVLGINFENQFSEDLDLFGGFKYTEADAKGMQDVGSVSASASITYTDAAGTSTTIAGSAADTIQAQLDDYKSWSVFAGLRKYFNRNSDFEKFIGGYVGYESTDEIKAKARLVTANLSTEKFKFFDDSDELLFGLQAGFNKSMNLTKGSVFGLTITADYHQDLSGNDTDLGLINLGAINNAGDGFDYGISAHMKVPF
jgi:hypothetical protein